jgi:hypothetical protein
MKVGKPARPQIFVLTLEEKKIIACVLGAIALGLATQHYRKFHPRPPVPPSPEQVRVAKSAQRVANAKARSAKPARASQPISDESDDD